MSTCINGCTKKRVDGEEPVPKQAVRGLLCGGCFHKLEDWLKDIPVDFALLPMALTAGGSQRYDGSTRTKQPEAPAPLRLDVASLADGRSSTAVALPDRGNPAHKPPTAGYSGVRDAGDELWYELPDIPSAVKILHTWAEQLRCDLDPQREHRDLNDLHTVYGESRYLLNALDRLSEAVWVDEAMTELRTLWNALCRAHGLVAGDSLGDCFTVPCDGKVYRDRFTGFPSCNVCQRVYDGLDLVRLKVTDEAS